MPINLTITLIVVSLFLILLTSYFLKIGRIPEKYALLWYLFSIIILIVSFFPNVFESLAKIVGIQLLSNMFIAILIWVLFLLVMSLTIMMSGQKKKTTLLIQEISILKSELESTKKH